MRPESTKRHLATFAYRLDALQKHQSVSIGSCCWAIVEFKNLREFHDTHYNLRTEITLATTCELRYGQSARPNSYKTSRRLVMIRNVKLKTRRCISRICNILICTNIRTYIFIYMFICFYVHISHIHIVSSSLSFFNGATF